MKMGYLENIDKEEVNLLPLGNFEGEIIVVDSEHNMESIVPELMREKVWGIDTETKPCFKKGKHNQNKTALIQLCGAQKVYLFRINKIKIPKVLLEIFSNPNIIKVGVALRDDIAGLQRQKKFEPASFVDLQQMVNDFGIEANGLRSLSAIVLGLRISKSQQLSNWEAEILDEKQLLYAATDAWAPREIYMKLNNL
jgi:ribonuclease D